MGKSGVAEVCLIIWLSLSIFLAALIFSRGFLLNRQIVSKKSQPCSTNQMPYDPGEINQKSLDSMVDWCRNNAQGSESDNYTPAYSKIILVLVDALRFDFIPRMKFLSRSIEQSKDTATAKSFRFIADPPTTTMQRLKALMTGTMPTFIDASANFNSYEVEEDNFIFQLHSANKRIAFLGDDTWLSLFPPDLFTSPFVEAHPSFNAWDLDTVDRAVNSSLHKAMAESGQEQWDVLIAHFLGVDHCGHRYGPKHPEMQRKLNEADSALEHVYKSMSSDTLLVVFGDHGMTKTGDHGGDSSDETESGLVFLSKSKDFASADTPSKSISQIDLAPTLSALFGLPIPFSSIGQIIPGLMDEQTYAKAMAANVAQVSRYIDVYSSVSNLNMGDRESLNEAYNKASQAYDLQSSQFPLRARLYLQLVKQVAINTWTQFDFFSIYLGIFLFLLSMGVLLLFLTSQNNSVWTLCVFYCTVFSLSTAWILIDNNPGILIIVLLGILGMTVFLKRGNGNHESSIQVRSGSILSQGLIEYLVMSIYGFTCLAVFSNSFVINEGTVLGSAFVIVVLLQVLASKVPDLRIAGVQNTDNVFASSLTSSNAKSSWINLFVLILIVRLGNLFFRCREELVDCQEEFLLHKHLPSLPEDWIVHKYVRYGEALLSLAVLVVVFRHHMMTRGCISGSRPAAVISKFIPTVVVVLTCAYWALQGLPFGHPQIAQSRFLNYIPTVFQSVTLVSMFIVWINPICCIGRVRNANANPVMSTDRALTKKSRKNSVHNNSRSTVYPYRRDRGHSRRSRNGHLAPATEDRSNQQQINLDEDSNNHENGSVAELQPDTLSEDVFSSAILTNGILVTLLCVQISSAGYTPVITLIPYTVICMLSISSRLPRHKSGSWSSVISWTLASQYFFYATGHQTVFSTIPWDSAFIGTSDVLGNVNDNWLSWIRPALAVMGNLHVSQIIFSVSLPLIVYRRRDAFGILIPETLMDKREMREVYVLGGKFIFLHGVKLLACILCATLHRRHLMVWKIFAPKFIFEGVSFLIVILAVSGTLFFITRLDYLFQKILTQEGQRRT